MRTCEPRLRHTTMRMFCMHAFRITEDSTPAHEEHVLKVMTQALHNVLMHQAHSFNRWMHTGCRCSSSASNGGTVASPAHCCKNS